jgi:hypothetical protein
MAARDNLIDVLMRAAAARRTQMPPSVPSAPPDFDPAAPRGGHRTRMPRDPAVPRMPDPSDFLRQMLAQGTADWQPGPTSPWSGLDAFNWKNNPMLGAPMEFQGNVQRGPSAEDLQYLKLFGDQMWQSPYRSAGSVVGNKSNRP